MAADTAETTTVAAAAGTKTHTVKPSAVRKLFQMEGLQGGVSCWGRGAINSEPTTAWLCRFSRERGPFTSIEMFSHRLAAALNHDLRGQLNGSASIGFHVAGYESDGRGPTFYHVHDGPSEYFLEATRKQVNAHNDCPPDKLKDLFRDGKIQEMRNGEFRPYAVVRDALGKAFDELNRLGWPTLCFNTLDDVVQYNVMEIRFMSDLYHHFGKPVIGGKIHSLAITCERVGLVVEHENTSGITKDFTFSEPPDEDHGPTTSGSGPGVSATPHLLPSSGFIPQTAKTVTFGF
jgi:hypothetical protein